MPHTAALPPRTPTLPPSTDRRHHGGRRRTRSVHVPRPAVVVIGGVLAIAAALAVVLALSLSRGGDRAPESVATPLGPVRSGPLTVKGSAGWSRPDTLTTLPGMLFSSPIALEERTSGLRLVAGVLPASSPTLLPAELVRRLQTPPARPTIVRLDNGTRAQFFRGLTATGVDGPLDVYVIPTTAGIATAACGSNGTTLAPYYDCWELVRTLTLRGARALALGPVAAFRQRLPGVVGALDTARERAREPLASRVPPEQAGAASGLATAYEGAAASMTPLIPRSPSVPKAIVREMAGAGSAYRVAASALQEADAAKFDAARQSLYTHERRLKQLLEALERR